MEWSDAKDRAVSQGSNGARTRMKNAMKGKDAKCWPIKKWSEKCLSTHWDSILCDSEETVIKKCDGSFECRKSNRKSFVDLHQIDSADLHQIDSADLHQIDSADLFLCFDCISWKYQEKCFCAFRDNSMRAEHQISSEIPKEAAAAPKNWRFFPKSPI
jgi:hypothetical protein